MLKSPLTSVLKEFIVEKSGLKSWGLRLGVKNTGLKCSATFQFRFQSLVFLLMKFLDVRLVRSGLTMPKKHKIPLHKWQKSKNPTPNLFGDISIIEYESVALWDARWPCGPRRLVRSQYTSTCLCKFERRSWFITIKKSSNPKFENISQSCLKLLST